MIGNIFARLQVIESAPKTDKHLKWLCVCSCGNKVVVRASALRTGRTKSCGCLVIERMSTHKEGKTRLYQTWINMRRRCTDPKAKDFKNYGALGVSYTPLWDDFAVFREWALSTGYTDDLTIDRNEVTGNYEPSNCKWADWSTQACNQRKETKTSSQYLGVSKRKDKWEASVKWLGKNKSIGVYMDEVSAAQARDAYITERGWPHKLNNV